MNPRLDVDFALHQHPPSVLLCNHVQSPPSGPFKAVVGIVSGFLLSVGIGGLKPGFCDTNGIPFKVTTRTDTPYSTCFKGMIPVEPAKPVGGSVNNIKTIVILVFLVLIIVILLFLVTVSVFLLRHCLLLSFLLSFLPPFFLSCSLSLCRYVFLSFFLSFCLSFFLALLFFGT